MALQREISIPCSALFLLTDLILFLLHFHRPVHSSGDLLFHIRDKARKLSGALVALEAASYGNRTVGLLLLSYDQHVGDLLGLGLADLVANLLRAEIDLCTDPGLIQLGLYRLCVFLILLTRWIMMGLCFSPSAPMYSRLNLWGIWKSSWMVPHCQVLPMQSTRWKSILGP